MSDDSTNSPTHLRRIRGWIATNQNPIRLPEMPADEPARYYHHELPMHEWRSMFFLDVDAPTAFHWLTQFMNSVVRENKAFVQPTSSGVSWFIQAWKVLQPAEQQEMNLRARIEPFIIRVPVDEPPPDFFEYDPPEPVYEDLLLFCPFFRAAVYRLSDARCKVLLDGSTHGGKWLIEKCLYFMARHYPELADLIPKATDAPQVKHAKAGRPRYRADEWARSELSEKGPENKDVRSEWQRRRKAEMEEYGRSEPLDWDDTWRKMKRTPPRKNL